MDSGTTPAASPDPTVTGRHRGLVGRTVLISGLTLVSRILGFVREMITAFVFGDVSPISDAFFTAWRVPNLFRRLLGEGALATSLQVVLTETDADAGEKAGKRLFQRTTLLAAVILLALSAFGMWLVTRLPDAMPVTGWHWLGSDPAPVRDLCVRLLPYVFFVCLAALLGGALQVRGHFAAPSFGPVAMNVTWIAALVYVALVLAGPDGGADQWEMARFLAWGVLLGGVVQLLVHVPPLYRHGLAGRSAESGPESRSGGHPGGWAGTMRVLRTSLPLALGAAVYQINVLVDGLMAEGLLSDGGPTALYYANRIQQFPLALVATAAGTAVFPALKAHAHVGERTRVRQLLDESQLGILFLALPAAVGLFLLARPIAAALFEHGNYGPAGGERIAAALRMLALALVPAGAVGLFGRTFIALGDPRTPVWIASVFLVVNGILNAFFVKGLGLDVEGLALATAVTSWLSLVCMAVLLSRRLGREGGVAIGRRVRGIVLATIACGVATSLVSSASAWGGFPGLVSLLGGGLAGLAAYAFAARKLGLQEWRAFTERLRRRALSRRR